MDIVLNEDERAALLVCSLEATRLYVLGLRPQMDVRSGLVGALTPVGYARFGLDVQYRPPQGSRREPWVVGRDAVINLVDELARVGLVRRESLADPGRKQLVLLLVKAYRGSCGQKHESHMRATPSDLTQTQQTSGLRQGEGYGEKSDEGHISESRRTVTENPLSEQPAVVVDTSAIARDGGAVHDVSRELALTKMLHGYGIDVTPAMLRRPEYAEALRQPVADWHAVAVTARARKGQQRVNVAYLLPMLADIRSASRGGKSAVAGSAVRPMATPLQDVQYGQSGRM